MSTQTIFIPQGIEVYYQGRNVKIVYDPDDFDEPPMDKLSEIACAFMRKWWEEDWIEDEVLRALGWDDISLMIERGDIANGATISIARSR